MGAFFISRASLSGECVFRRSELCPRIGQAQCFASRARSCRHSGSRETTQALSYEPLPSRQQPEEMIASKLPNVGTTIFTRMSQLAAEAGAINLSQGFPDFSAPAALCDAVGQHIAAGHNQYAPMTGLPALREQVAAKVATFYGRAVSADAEVTITPGATEAIFCAIQAVVRAGDEVIVLDPCYDSYEPSVELAGGAGPR